MKLLYITNGICGSGGLERVLSVKASLLAEDYHYNVTIATLNEENHQPFYSFSKKIRFITFRASGNPIKYVMQYEKSIKKLVKEVRPDIILVCDDGLKGFFIPKIIGKNIPIIYERHVSKKIEQTGEQISLQTRIKFWLMNHLAHSFSSFVVLTEGNKKEWNLKNLIVIPNPLPFNSEKQSALETKSVIAVGKQSYQKGYDMLLKSWSLLNNKSDWSLQIYGKKDKTLQLDALAKKLKIDKQVNFHNATGDILEKYLDSSIFVLSSRFEGFGMVIIEAMNCGLPVIAYDCPYGPGDIVTNNADGFLIDNGDTEKFAEKLGLLMNNQDLRKTMGSRARKSSENYDQNKIVKQWDELFKRTIK